MKILYAGNIANIGYTVAKELRKNDLEIDLLMEKSPIVEQDPLKQDPDLQNSYPDWVKFYEKNQSGWKRKIIKLMKSYDIVESQYEHNIFAYFARRPLISQIVGDDLRELAFSNSLRGFLLRRAFGKAKAVLYTTPAELSLLSRLNIKNALFLPLFVNLDFFKPIEVPRGDLADKLVVFHPSNLWHLKGNVTLIEGFAKFVKNNPGAVLIMIDRGPDSQTIHGLVTRLGIEKNTFFLKGPLDSATLRHYYNVADIIADQFVVPEIGGIGREALCCQKPLMTIFDEAGYEKTYGEIPPALNATNSQEILERLEHLTDAKVRLELGKRGREWVCKFHSLDLYSKKIAILYEGIQSGQKLDQISERMSKIS